MTCSKCGALLPEGAAFCAACGQPAVAFTPDVAKKTPAATDFSATTGPRVFYAGFWLRLAALVLDWILVSFATTPVLAVLFLRAGLMTMPPGQPPNEETMLRNAPTVFAAYAIVFVLTGLYFSLMESSPWQATMGKRAFRLIVTDTNGHRITFGRATARYFAKLLSGLLFGLGYVMAAFTERKQALHDIITECLVVRRKG